MHKISIIFVFVFSIFSPYYTLSWSTNQLIGGTSLSFKFRFWLSFWGEIDTNERNLKKKWLWHQWFMINEYKLFSLIAPDVWITTHLNNVCANIECRTPNTKLTDNGPHLDSRISTSIITPMQSIERALNGLFSNYMSEKRINM